MKKIVLALALSALVTPTFAKEKDSQASRFEKLELFNKVIHIIETNYYRKVNIDKLIDGALKGMFQTLDPHSAFLDKEVFKKMQEDTSGEYGGLGIEVTQKDGVLVITTPIEDSPAEKAGLKPGDKIVEINNESTIGITLDEAVDRMKGDLGTVINLGILRAGERDIRYFDVKRQKIKTKPVKSYAVKDYVVIRLSQFQKDAARHVVRALKKHKKELGKKFKGVVLDLRSNPGGLLNEAVNLSSIFLNDGVVVSTEGRDPKNKEIRYVKKSGHKELDCPLAVLIDGKSASASEIVAGALQDHKRAIVVGTNSFGKGSVQTVSQITEDAGIKLTIAQYMTPKGRKIQALGIKPDVMVSQVEGEFVEENMYDDGGIREVDLRNHLTATVETEEEKKARLKREKIARKKRIERAREINKHIKNKDKDRKYSASEDYQVIQAIKFLNTVNKFKKM
ncbi:peptidase, S41 family [Halobacteriovorax sp. BALOs_7]|uniref:S41 family peptidase n=1 Tax=Halobacteriovorax vibrionivorans TaxID=2152716 RepID=A0ABY0IMR7_9BACT|nr:MULTISPECIES: S41 family peptidase [Halobacteriovorax]AYF45458.1 peptidase, S41 family [Halobacteriovorax sp. BALOs_7]RZF22537.1 S41 family peptidase [Halobacteriovorax vibrionivorans]TGD47729.1 S41 family peptidase [Halobacteriovorax sp. Y22]